MMKREPILKKVNKKYIVLSIAAVIVLIAVIVLAGLGRKPVAESGRSLDGVILAGSLAEMILGVLLALSGIAVIIVYAIVHDRWKSKSSFSQCVAFAVFSLIGGLFIFLNSGELLYYIFKDRMVLDALKALSDLLIFPTACWYFYYKLEERMTKRITAAAFAGTALCIGLAVVLWMTGTPVPQCYRLATLAETAMVILAGICFFYESMVKRNNNPYFVIVIYFPSLVCILIKTCFDRLTAPVVWIIVSLEVVFIVLVQIYAIIQLTRSYFVKERHIRELEKQLSENRITIMMSQIQPHFLYNAMSTIQALCTIDPEKATQAINLLGKYLRVNMDSLKMTYPVMFQTELKHLKNYLFLEQLRYGERLKVEFDIAADSFSLPILTVQPLVENAIKHGIAKKEEGGFVRVATRDLGEYIEITISDNGVGFDVESCTDLEGHIGISNVKKRLSAMCGGSMEIESTVGKGTTVILKIPAYQE